MRKGLDETVYTRRIMTVAAQSIGLPVRSLVERGRLASLNRARSLAMLLIRERTGFSSKEIGSFFNRDHSTVLSNVEAAKRRVLTHAAWADHYARIVTELDGRRMQARLAKAEQCEGRKVRVAR